MIWKRLSVSIFIQRNKLIGSKIKDEKEVPNSLMVINLLNINHPFQGKEYLRI